ncbi:TetR family transcriptional regulator [Streptomyces nigrescens]|uniref:TetR family transcriptional regulator n=2 Tax=Streptomyces TaxID=1883 RepID=A0ABM7ZTN3_STRNI|nr:TetR/AcrR family transcriptional regulator [Streptomyces nigrescens]MEE4417945.1 TetR/AcrR family transcriptional regulator [Streptomyces sp. DSM 41528]BDM69724.1 TetR family transcriptional regulator [Streptomyces nigrescens]
METLREKYAENTRRTLLDTALRLFTEREYSSVPAEELVRTAGLTRGALYHHFDGKLGLFEAVFEDLERQATQRIRAAIDSVSDPRERADRAVDEFLDVCMEHAYRHIVLQQGPIALGWQRWRELDQRHLGGLVLDIVNAALDAGRIRPHPAELIARAFYGTLTELSLAIAEADSPDQARTQAADLVRDLVDGLAIDAPSSST